MRGIKGQVIGSKRNQTRRNENSERKEKRRLYLIKPSLPHTIFLPLVLLGLLFAQINPAQLVDSDYLNLDLVSDLNFFFHFLNKMVG